MCVCACHRILSLVIFLLVPTKKRQSYVRHDRTRVSDCRLCFFPFIPISHLTRARQRSGNYVCEILDFHFGCCCMFGCVVAGSQLEERDALVSHAHARTSLLCFFHRYILHRLSTSEKRNRVVNFLFCWHFSVRSFACRSVAPSCRNLFIYCVFYHGSRVNVAALSDNYKPMTMMLLLLLTVLSLLISCCLPLFYWFIFIRFRRDCF